jgi:hypothetical protein
MLLSMNLRIHGLGMALRWFRVAFFCEFAEGTLDMPTLLTSGSTKAGQRISNVCCYRLYTRLQTVGYLP